MKRRVIIGVSALAIIIYLFNSLVLQPKSVAKQLKSVAQNLNGKCPIILDQISKLDSVGSISNKNFIYYQSLYRLHKNEINFDSVNQNIRPKLIKEIKNNPNFKAFKKNNITIDYVFHDMYGVFINKLSFKPEVYGE
ncbi:hypothetical protein [Flavivirga algicola]|uniref:Uncharacterized protein n=1 Tax=Flavivirga algicola TaxID=2729136 RepID=A0ABX1RX08_9FLAO|nr:hypothetical protein [Flavivirga algicola]NMH86749.1 hypothetical protein [Flavivirga algicola]